MKKNKHKILIVDDEEEITQLLKNYLLQYNYSVLTAKNAFETIEILNTISFDIILLDLALPKMDGNEILQKIKDINPNTKIILITAYRDPQRIVQAFRNGVCDCIFKPFNLEVLKKVIENKLKK